MEDRPKKGLRKGYTTGTCAAAACKGATIAFFTRKKVKEVQVTLPIGEAITLPIHRCEIGNDTVLVSVIKDAGDDPDVTNGAEIQAVVSGQWSVVRGVKAFQFSISNFQFPIFGGKGVGIITRPGLAIPVGEPAINPVPRKMIEDSIKEIWDLGFRIWDLKSKIRNPKSEICITISVPNGEEIAKKTMNPRLGIIGGISILGTTGIVEPLSLSAYRHSIICAIDVAIASGSKKVVFSTGRSSERVAQQALNLPEEAFILVGDHMGFALKKTGVRCQGPGTRKNNQKTSHANPLKRVTIAGQFGKLSKLAAGHFETHSSNSSIELEFLTGLSKEAGAKRETIEEIKGANTARQVFLILKGQGLEKVFKMVCEKVRENAKVFTQGRVEIGCMLVGYENKIVEKV